MAQHHHRHHHAPPGSAPGTIIVQPCAAKPVIDVMSWGPQAAAASVQRETIASIAELPALPAGHTIRWINVCGLGDADVLRAIGARFGLHPLTIEDIATPVQRPKIDTYADYLFLVTRVPASTVPQSQTVNADATLAAQLQWIYGSLATEQLALCVGKDFLITFQEDEQDAFAPVRDRLTSDSGQMRDKGADYLAYAVLDAAIDAYFPLLEACGEAVDDFETELVERPAPKQIARIHNLKRNLLTARRAVWPQREMLAAAMREDTPFISADTKLFLRDCYDHTVELIDMIEVCRETASSLVDIQFSSQSNRMNEIMKVLTIIATIFIPLSFITGVYGMNFDRSSRWNLPELAWRFGYPAVLVVMATIAGVLLLWFRRKGWLGRPKD